MTTMALPGTRRDGGRLRTRLLVLVLVPLLGVAAFAAAEINSRSSSAQNARQVENLLTTAAHASKARTGLMQELVPSLARAILQVPIVAAKLHITSVSIAQLGLSDAQVVALRERTDTAMTALEKDRRTHQLATQLEPQITLMRRQIDSGVAIPAAFDLALKLINRLTTAQNNIVADATGTGVVDAASTAARDLDRATQVIQLAELELPRLAAVLFPELAPPSESAVVVQEWLQVWGGYTTAYATLLTQGSKSMVAALRTATSTPEAKFFDRTAAAAAKNPSIVQVDTLIQLYRAGQARSVALGKVLDLAVNNALSAAAAQRHSAVVALWTIAAIVLAVFLASVLIGWWMLRSLARPLQNLANSARKVSEGVLDDVPVDGPHEVRTAARGLAAAVANLRNIEAQAAAVAAGELDSDVVRRPLPGPLGEVVHASVETIVGAIHERDAAQTDLAYRAAHDPLTELTNRAQAMVAIERSLHRAQRNGTGTGLMFVDLDHFKTVNDTLGHEAGDAVLVRCARRMTDVVRGGDTVARLGGDEFVILLEDITDETDVVKLAERVVRTLAAPIQLGHRQLHVGASVGVAICTDGYIDAGRLLSEADAAAYQAKKDGRGRYSIFNDALREEMARRAALDLAIADGLTRGEFVLYYQPVVDLRTGQPQGVEALIRWNRPGHGLVPPNEFIPSAETSALINDIGRWTLFEATAQLTRWDQAIGTNNLTVGVNISGRHLCSDDLLNDVKNALDAAGLAPNRLIVELTETVLVENMSAASNLMALRELGVQVAIDDFGTGFTSIGQLLRLPIDTLKIDRSFVASTDPAHQELVQLMARAAHAFGLHVIAEGVEDATQLGNLANCAVEAAQGFHFARPQAADDALALMRLPALPAFGGL
jgi:diguanylate cyclase (GGDEF)-like protein